MYLILKALDKKENTLYERNQEVSMYNTTFSIKVYNTVVLARFT